MPRTRYSRRDVLRIAGSGSLLLWPILRERSAVAAAPVKRFLAVFFPNGSPGGANEVFYPKVSGSTWDFAGRVTEPLKPFQDQLSFHTNLRIQNQLGGAHNGGICSFLTGANISKGEPLGRHNGDFPDGPSLDWYAAKQTNTPLLNVGVESNNKVGWNITWEARDRMVLAETDPAAAYTAVFKSFVDQCKSGAGGAPPTSAPAAGLTERKLVLDQLKDDLGSARRLFGLGAEERSKLERYEQSLLEIEKRLSVPGPTAVAGACSQLPGAPTSGGTYTTRIRLMADIVAAALGLGLRRSASLQMFHAYSDHNLSSVVPGIGSRAYHAMTHDAGYANRERDSKLIVTYFTEQFAYLLGKMKAFSERDSNLLANSLVIYGSDTTTSFTHNHKEPPAVMLAGGAGGSWKAGTVLGGGIRHNCELLATICRALDVDPAHFQKQPGYQADLSEFLRA